VDVRRSQRDEASFHDGYAQALEDLSRLLRAWAATGENDLERVEREVRRRIDEALLRNRCSLASNASGDAGY